MESVLRGLVVYFFLLLLFRMTGKRTLAQSSPFEFVLLLIIGETTQEAMIDDDHSITNALLLILTLVGASVLLSILKQRSATLEQWLEGIPVVVVDNGRLLEEPMRATRVSREDLLVAARQTHGLERMDQIKFAVVEASGEISIIPKES